MTVAVGILGSVWCQKQGKGMRHVRNYGQPEDFTSDNKSKSWHAYITEYFSLEFSVGPESYK